MIKKCANCGECFNKKKTTSIKMWKKKKYCSKDCYTESMVGKKLPKDRVDKMSGTAKKAGCGRWMKGRKLSKETKKKMSGRTGEKSGNWQGGKTFEKYPVDWTNTLRISIRERDKYRCRMCGEPQGDEAHCVHHIDYNKKNCNPDNLITLCRSCHAKTNSNRDYWIEYFKANI